MTEVILIKRWLNHEPGTVIKSVSPGILAELERLGAIEVPEAVKEKPPRKRKEKKKTKAFKKPPVDRMVKEEETKEAEECEAEELPVEEIPEISETGFEEKED